MSGNQPPVPDDTEIDVAVSVMGAAIKDDALFEKS
jgi:hypothetical protein